MVSVAASPSGSRMPSQSARATFSASPILTKKSIASSSFALPLTPLMITLYLSARSPLLTTRSCGSSYVQPGSQRTFSSAGALVAFLNSKVCPFADTQLPSGFCISRSTFRLPAWILFTAVEAESVNHAKVVPINIAKQRTIAMTLESNARFVVFLLFIVFPP